MLDLNSVKRIKDPVYGYIEIPSDFVENVIDTCDFQRLRRIVQTSYAPLYSSALHNRFIHSLGVFYLGRIAQKRMQAELKRKEYWNDKYLTAEKIFLLACLLHDVGHAPFSHTGEQYYLDENSSFDSLHGRLSELIGNDELIKEFQGEHFKNAAPHELMSAIVGLNKYGCVIGDNVENREFFSRCITGYNYKNSEINSQIKNCYIQLLNSEVIDVDRLDYLIRDAFFTGYDTVNIDYFRLLESLTVVEYNGKLSLAFQKSAISVIENVVYAHDSERKWIQSHPTVLYENYIINHAIDVLNRELDANQGRLFSEESLSDVGVTIKGHKIRLLCDDDIVHLVKSMDDSRNELLREFFCRNIRRHPTWKSEAEYKSYLLKQINGGEFLDDFKEAIELTSNYMRKNTDAGIINELSLSAVENEITRIEGSILDDEDKTIQLKEKKKILRVMCALKEYSLVNGLAFDYVILTTSEFNSGFGKINFYDMPVVFDDKGLVSKFGDVAASFSAENNGKEIYFYIYYQRDKNKTINKSEFCKYLFKEIVFNTSS